MAKKYDKEKYDFLCKMAYDSFVLCEQDAQWIMTKCSVLLTAIVAFMGTTLFYNIGYIKEAIIFISNDGKIYVWVNVIIIVTYYIVSAYSLYNCFNILKTKKFLRINILENWETYKKGKITLEKLHNHFLDKNMKKMYCQTEEVRKEVSTVYNKSLKLFAISLIIYSIFIIITLFGG